jgi:GNAT superfamily N-acetyltransferase
VLLRDGTEIVLRRIRPDDAGLLVAGMSRLSAESLRLRFLAPRSHLTAAELRYLTEVDFVDHYAVVAVHAAEPSRLAGVGRWVRDAGDPASAEVAVVVCDDLQGLGLGTALGSALAEAARARGVTRFTATILSENRPAQRLFRHLSGQLTARGEAGVCELAGELAA